MKSLNKYIGITLASLVLGIVGCELPKIIEKEGCKGTVIQYSNKTIIITVPEIYNGVDTNNDGKYEEISQFGEGVISHCSYSCCPELVKRATTRLDETKKCILGEQK